MMQQMQMMMMNPGGYQTNQVPPSNYGGNMPGVGMNNNMGGGFNNQMNMN